MKKYISIYIVFVLILYLIPLSTLLTNKEKEQLKGEEIVVYDAESEETFTVPLEEYVFKTLAKEMPALFNDEALKAQAVAIRTYTLKKKGAENEKHPTAVVCTDSNHCMAYMKGEVDEEYEEKLKNAVLSTEGEVLMYDNEYASTVFHAISSGRTESSEAVWGGKVPYLVSVDSSGDKNVKGYETKAEVSYEELVAKLNGRDFEKVIGKEERTDCGTVKTITLCGKEYSGSKIRELFNLRSANFKIEEKDNLFVFTVYGYGHGVGMSQYGAENMAREGHTYKEILAHFYPGTELKSK